MISSRHQIVMLKSRLMGGQYSPIGIFCVSDKNQQKEKSANLKMAKYPFFDETYQIIKSRVTTHDHYLKYAKIDEIKVTPCHLL